MSNEELSGHYIRVILAKAAHSMNEHDRSVLETLGLGISDFAVMEVLLHKGPLPVNTIGKSVLLTSGSITTAVDRLSKRGLVKRRPSKEDGRVVNVELTSKGQRFIEPVFDEHAAAMEDAIDCLTQNERKSLTKLLKKLGKHLDSLAYETVA